MNIWRFKQANKYEYGLVISICRKCHQRWKTDENLRNKRQAEAKQKFKETYTEEFIKIFGANYL